MTVKEEPRFIPKRTPCKMVAHALIPAFRRLKEETRDFKVVENLRASAGLKNKTKQNNQVRHFSYSLSIELFYYLG